MTFLKRSAMVALACCLGTQLAARAETGGSPPLLAVGSPGPAFDGRQWTVGYQGANAAQSVVEYVLPGETVDTWRELLTHQTMKFGERSVTLAALVEQTRAGLGQGCPSLRWEMLAQSDTEAVYRWSDGGCGGSPPQFEIARLRRVEGGFCRWAYASKQVPVPAATQEAIRRQVEKLPCN